MEFDEFIKKAGYSLAIGILFGLCLTVLALVLFGVFLCLLPLVSICRKKLLRRKQEDQGNELNTLPTSIRTVSATRPLHDAADKSSPTLVPSEQ